MCLLKGGYLLLGKGSFIRWGSEWRTRLSQCQNIDSCFGHAVRGACEKPGWDPVVGYIRLEVLRIFLAVAKIKEKVNWTA